ncbi:MAG: plasmid mobilization relaxosome protein MobC [Pseudomonadota bacterium]
MTAARNNSAPLAKRQFSAATRAGHKTRTTLSPVTLRLTPDERARLEGLASGMTLSAYIRACIFAGDAQRRARSAPDPTAEKKPAAEALALLGQSRIASNLNQLAHHANIGILIVGDLEKAQIAEANAHLSAIRTLLMQALGKTR